MKAHRGSPTGPGPEVSRQQRVDGPAYILHSLEKGMRDGLQERGDAWNGAAEPDFGGNGTFHAGDPTTRSGESPPGSPVDRGVNDRVR